MLFQKPEISVKALDGVDDPGNFETHCNEKELGKNLHELIHFFYIPVDFHHSAKSTEDQLFVFIYLSVDPLEESIE